MKHCFCNLVGPRCCWCGCLGSREVRDPAHGPFRLGVFVSALDDECPTHHEWLLAREKA